MGLLGKLKQKVEDTKQELGLGSSLSSSSQHPLYPARPPYPQYPPQSGQQQYYPQAQGQYSPPGQHYPLQGAPPTFSPPAAYPRPQATGYPVPPSGQWNQYAAPPGPPPRPSAPPPIPARPAGFETQPQPQQPASSPPAIPPRPENPKSPGIPARPASRASISSERSWTDSQKWAGIDQTKLGEEQRLHQTKKIGPMTKILGLYYPSWRVYADLPPSKMEVNLATHIFYAFARPTASGGLEHTDDWAADFVPCDGEKGCLVALKKLKVQNPGLKILLSIGGATDSGAFVKLAASKKTIRRFAQTARTWVDKYGLDGVDIDWEHPSSAAEGRNYILLLSQLRHYLPYPQYELTSALPPGEWILRNIDLRAAGQLLDYLNVMCYDFTGPWSAASGHHAALHPSMGGDATCAGGITYLMSHGFPAAKLVLGVPTYAQYFPAATGPGQSFDKSKAGTADVRDFPPRWLEQAHVDPAIAAAWTLDEEKGWVSFDTNQTVAVKGQYVMQQGLGGMFFWHGVGDAPSNRTGALVQAGWNALAHPRF